MSNNLSQRHADTHAHARTHARTHTHTHNVLNCKYSNALHIHSLQHIVSMRAAIINSSHTDKLNRLQQAGQLVSNKTSQIIFCLTSSGVYRYRWTVFRKFGD